MAITNFSSLAELLNEAETLAYDENTAAVRLLKAKKAGFDMLVVGYNLDVDAGAELRIAGDSDGGSPSVTSAKTGAIRSDSSRELGKVAIRIPDGEDFVLDHVGAFRASGYFQIVFLAKAGA